MATTIGGVHERLLRVELRDGSAAGWTEPLPPQDFRDVIGGIGLASLLLLRLCPPGTDPLGPANPLIFATSPFVGTGITTASKLAVVARSPQTGMIGDSLSSSYLALALKRTGHDALAITGALNDWHVLVVDEQAISLLPGTDLLGLSPREAGDRLRAELGAAFRVAAIGPAGERGVRYAAIANDGRLAGRTGNGAVMAAKRLKAIAIRGGHLPPVADPRRVAALARDLATRSLGPATAKYRDIGTVANLAFFNRLGLLPTRNFGATSLSTAEAEAISGESLRLEHHTSQHACAACTVGCEHHYRTRDEGPETSARLEYETLFALGSLCGVSDPNVVLRASALCDDLGMDAISAGATIAWAMECRERGVDLGVPREEVPHWGDGAALLRVLSQIGMREGLGDLLADGSRAASARVGQGSEAWAMHVKGLELPGYDPRKLKTLALGLAVSARGACHNRSSAYEVDLSDQLDPAADVRARAKAAVAAEDQAALFDSLTLCKFLRHALGDVYEESAALYRAVTGLETTADDLHRAAGRINEIKKRVNLAHGWTRALDTLPPRILHDDGAGPHIDPVWLQRQIDAYYAQRGWDAEGRQMDVAQQNGMMPGCIFP
jgi:aldehyde:ferredoxin oxidoreductase